MAKVKITEGLIAREQANLGDGASARVRLWDESLVGYGVIIGRRFTTAIVQHRINGEQALRTIGRLGTPGPDGKPWTEPRARKAAAIALGRMKDGIDPEALKRSREGGPTLADARDLHLKKLRGEGGSPRSIGTIETECRKYLADWLDRPLATITRTECREIHETLTSDNGPYLANRVMRHVRALWNTMLKEHDLPANPTVAVHWNKEHRRQEPIEWGKLPAWRATVDTLDPVRRDYNLTVMLTGLRRMDAATMRWEHLDLKARTLHRPNPKGGEERAFTIPLSKALAKILEARKADNKGADGGWCFPTFSTKDKACDLCAALGLPAHKKRAAIHLVEAKEQRIDEEGNVTRILPSPHRLRDTYTTALADLKDPPLSPYVIDVLTNHRPPGGSVTAGYINLSTDSLAEAQERVSAFILARCKPPTARKRRAA